MATKTSIRLARLPEDADQITALDRSFTTVTFYTAQRDGDNISLRREMLATPIMKSFPMDDLNKPDRPWEFAAVATDSLICGFVAAGYQAWNCRLTIWHLYVAQNHRRRGFARLLLDAAAEYGATQGGLNMWLETSNLNVPGVEAYRRLGFELCGMDTTLYDGTPSVGEVALFFARPISAR